MKPSGPVSRRLKRLLRILLAVAGAAIFIRIFSTVGWPAVAKNLGLIGGWFPALAALYLLPQLAFALGWWETIDPRPPAAFFPRLFAVYCAGDTVNYLGPANVAGEPLKAHLLRGEIDLSRSVASLTVHKHADMLAQFLFALGGFLVALAAFDLPRAALVAGALGVGGLGALLLLLSWALRRGTFSPLLRKLSGLTILEGRLGRYQGDAEKLDARIRGFYTQHRGRYFKAVAWSLLGWCGGLAETWIVLALLGSRADFQTAFAIEALAMVLNNMLSWMPGRIGTAEGVRVGIFVLLGLPAAAGAAYALVRRGREILWTLPGACILLFRNLPTRAEAL
jgi:uncharacterized protein (TIRG00374 family)